MVSTQVRCVFLDRDGTLIRHIPYLSDPAQVDLLPTVVEGLDVLTQAGCRLFLHTNQSGIGRGYFTEAQADACNKEMLRQIGRPEPLFTGVCMSPEMPGEEPKYRKPAPHFALEMLAKYSIVPEQACYVGDSISDLLTAKNFGGLGVGVNTGIRDLRESLAQAGLTDEFSVFDSFVVATRYIANWSGA